MNKTLDIFCLLIFFVVYGNKISLVAQTVKCLPVVRETWVQSLGWEDLLEKERAPHSSILAWKIPWTEEPTAAAAAAAAAKSLQSCPILCDPIDGSSPGVPVPGILQARTLE